MRTYYTITCFVVTVYPMRLYTIIYTALLTDLI